MITFVCVVNGAAYVNYAEKLFESAKFYTRFIDHEVNYTMLKGRSGWPAATMYRYHALLKEYPEGDYVFLVDADMLFVDFVGGEILPEKGIAATLHPGYVGRSRAELPYEDKIGSACYIPSRLGGSYYCGGFIGGTRPAMKELAEQIVFLIELDKSNSHVPRWHDESALNKALSFEDPEVVLSPSYCYPQNDSWYRTFWQEEYTPRLMALDKTQEERGER